VVAIQSITEGKLGQLMECMNMEVTGLPHGEARRRKSTYEMHKGINQKNVSQGLLQS
jgi:hypothetical protein